MSDVDMKYTDMTGQVDFSTFDIRDLRENPDDLWSLGGGVLVDLAGHFDHPIEHPTVDYLSELIRKVGANKELQLNVGDGKQVLGAKAYATATQLLVRSGIMRPLNRSFLNPHLPVPHGCRLVITGGVANWMLRRAAVASQVGSINNRRVYMAIGERQMKTTEHSRVELLADHLDHLPTEADFASRFLVPMLEDLDGFDVELLRASSTNGDAVLRELFETYPQLLEENLLVIGNAPNAIQGAGQLRAVAREINPDFDTDGSQLFVRSDAFPVAREGDSTADGQNPVSGLGALARAALFLVKATLN